MMRGSDAHYASGIWGLEFSSDKALSSVFTVSYPHWTANADHAQSSSNHHFLEHLVGDGPTVMNLGHSKNLPYLIKAPITTTGSF